MKLIRELHEADEVEFITESTEDGKKKHYIEGIFLQSEIANRNRRFYPKKVLQKEVNRYVREYVNQKRAFGELGHPNGPTINLDRTSHIIESIREDGNNFIGKARILETPMGKIVKTLIDEGARLGVSSRGMGTLKTRSDGINEVQNDFMLATAADIVADPSAPNAFVEGIMEGVDWLMVGGVWVPKFIEQAQKTINETPRRDREAKALKLFENYLRKLR